MSIDYTFTRHGTIQIECGDEWIEVRLPGVGGSAKPKPAPPAPEAQDPPPKARPAGLPSEGRQAPEPEPFTAPGVMSIISSARKPKDTKDLFMFDVSDIEHMDLSQFEHLDLTDMQRAIRDQMARVTRSMGEIKLLEVDIGPLSENSTAALTNLQKLLREPDSGIDALRLWRNDEIG
jgi:hypothetical protein